MFYSYFINDIYYNMTIKFTFITFITRNYNDFILHIVKVKYNFYKCLTVVCKFIKSAFSYSHF